MLKNEFKKVLLFFLFLNIFVNSYVVLPFKREQKVINSSITIEKQLEYYLEKDKIISTISFGEEPKGLETDSAFPCGICRQVMREFVNPKEFKIYVCATKDKYNIYTLEEILPHSFGPEYLLG